MHGAAVVARVEDRRLEAVKAPAADEEAPDGAAEEHAAQVSPVQQLLPERSTPVNNPQSVRCMLSGSASAAASDVTSALRICTEKDVMLTLCFDPKDVQRWRPGVRSWRILAGTCW